MCAAHDLIAHTSSMCAILGQEALVSRIAFHSEIKNAIVRQFDAKATTNVVVYALSGETVFQLTRECLKARFSILDTCLRRMTKIQGAVKTTKSRLLERRKERIKVVKSHFHTVGALSSLQIATDKKKGKKHVFPMPEPKQQN